MSDFIRIISSMATKPLLTELIARHADTIALETIGGVDAARRVRAGEPYDVAVLAAAVIDALATEGRIVAGSRVDLVRSGVAVAVRAGAPRVDIATEDGLRQSILQARTIGYSTGPSGVHLERVFARWGIADTIAGRVVQAPPGVPVGSLVADGRVELGFQQLSELLHIAGIEVLGPLPPEVQTVTTFSAGITSASNRADEVRALLATWAAPETADVKRRLGMEPA